MAKLTARGHRILWEASRKSANTDTTWHWALRSDGKLLRRTTSHYETTYRFPDPAGGPDRVSTSVHTDSGHWTVSRSLWTPATKQSERIMAEQAMLDKLKEGGYTVSHKEQQKA